MSGSAWSERLARLGARIDTRMAILQCSDRWFSDDAFEETMHFERALQRVVTGGQVAQLDRLVPQILGGAGGAAPSVSALRNHAQWLDSIAAWERFGPGPDVVRTRLLLSRSPYTDQFVIGDGTNDEERRAALSVRAGLGTTPLLASDRLTSVRNTFATASFTI